TYLAVVREESARFVAALDTAAWTDPVPTCPGWTVSDLVWHLAEVQHFWARVVADGLTGDQVPELPRPADGDLRALVGRSGADLLGALAGSEPGAPCWSWSEGGQDVGWVARRQAHEVLIHRVDAEVAAGRPVTAPSVELAADGVDEMLRVMLDGVPGPGDLTLDGATVRLSCTDARADWVLALGWFVGARADGSDYELDVAVLLAQDDGGTDDVVVSGTAWDLDRWLWGRGPLAALSVEGDVDLLTRLRSMVVEATQ
ncbi:MAG TPA: maleylpyruvate isomerase family mycothiol-dependent enzyme, partial [Actinotalea sp.]|nr:maleylpyruvate isomerase family mycothiol-dependent enzyme [Actinotalea sp.]